MFRLVIAAGVLCTLTGCATVLNETTHPMRVDTKTASGELVNGADCSVTNDKGRFTLRSGETVQVRRSSKDLDITCSHPGQPGATARAISRTNSGMWGNILIGGAIGAVVDHTKGTAYTYPTWVQLVFGRTLSFDRRDEKKGGPTPPEEVASQGAATGVPVATPAQQEATSTPQAATVQTSGGGSPLGRAQDVSSKLGCGPVSQDPANAGRSVYLASCPSGVTMEIDCSGWGCKSTIR